MGHPHLWSCWLRQFLRGSLTAAAPAARMRRSHSLTHPAKKSVANWSEASNNARTVSEIRRERQAARMAPPSRMRRLVLCLGLWWKKILLFIGIGGVGDLIREFARAKAMDWLYSRLGSVGQWALSYKLALLTISAGAFIAISIIFVVREWSRTEDSSILNSKGIPYKLRGLSTKQAVWFVGPAILSILLVSYGTFRYYQTSVPSLLEKYPLGYVIFGVDSVNSVFPYPRHGYAFISNLEFDWSVVRIVEETPDHIRIRLPDIGNRINSSLFIGNTIGLPKKAGESFPILSLGGIDETGEIMAVRRNGTAFVIGFKRSPKLG